MAFERIRDFQLVKTMLADDHPELHPGRSMVQDCALRYDAKLADKSYPDASLHACTPTGRKRVTPP